eukprot:137224-Pelagomonas_calceolata.AAC.4
MQKGGKGLSAATYAAQICLKGLDCQARRGEQKTTIMTRRSYVTAPVHGSLTRIQDPLNTKLAYLRPRQNKQLNWKNARKVYIPPTFILCSAVPQLSGCFGQGRPDCLHLVA